MRLTARQIAQICHEANRALQLITGDPNPSPHWEDAEEWQTESAVQGVVEAINGATPEQLHEGWCENKRKEGWRYGETKDPDLKTHPCLVDYSQLPEEQRAKDHLFYAIVNALMPKPTPAEQFDIGRHEGRG